MRVTSHAAGGKAAGPHLRAKLAGLIGILPDAFQAETVSKVTRDPLK